MSRETDTPIPVIEAKLRARAEFFRLIADLRHIQRSYAKPKDIPQDGIKAWRSALLPKMREAEAKVDAQIERLMPVLVSRGIITLPAATSKWQIPRTSDAYRSGAIPKDVIRAVSFICDVIHMRAMQQYILRTHRPDMYSAQLSIESQIDAHIAHGEEQDGMCLYPHYIICKRLQKQRQMQPTQA